MGGRNETRTEQDPFSSAREAVRGKLSFRDTLFTEEVLRGACMQKKITAQTVIKYVYMLFRKRRTMSEDIRREVNKLIVKYNAHLCSEGDKIG